MSIAAIALAATLSVTPTTAGTGFTLGGAYYLDKAGWSVQFYDTYTRDKVGAQVKLTAAELRSATGVDVQYTSTINKTDAVCPGMTSTGRHRIVVRLEPTNTRSYTYACNTGWARSTASVHLSGTKWTSTLHGGTHEAYRRNVVSHEMGHAMGLGHPDCTNVPGTDPLMCGDHWGGYVSPYTVAQKYTPYDVSGLKALVSNRP